MPKQMISIPAGNLMSVAATKGIPHLSALKEKTSVDRKTLRAINAGKPVKTTTLQFISDKLRIPISYLLASNAADNNEAAERIGELNERSKTRELKLQRLDGAALHKLASEAYKINWFLNIDQMSCNPTLLEIQLKGLQKNLKKWWHHINGVDPDDDEDNLLQQLSYFRTSSDIDKCVEQLAKDKLKILGGTYVFWEREQPSRDGHILPILEYSSHHRAVLNIVSENKTNDTINVAIGWEPPPKFLERDLPGIERVFIDWNQVWSRETVSDEVARYESCPF